MLAFSQISQLPRSPELQGLLKFGIASERERERERERE